MKMRFLRLRAATIHGAPEGVGCTRPGHATRCPAGIRRIRPLGVLVVLLSTAMVATACGGSNGNSGTTEKTLTYAMNVPPKSLNPAKDFQTDWRSLTNENIFTLKPDGSIGAGLATKWGYVGNGNKVFKFTLRDNAKFSDGTPVNAAAVKTWLEYFPTEGGSYAGLMGKIDTIDVVDEFTVQINLAAPNPAVERLLSSSGLNWGGVSSADVVQSDPEKLATNTYGAGPYVIDQANTVVGDTYTLVPNQYYYDKSKIYWDKIVIRTISDPATSFQAFQAGEVDAMRGNYSTVDNAEKVDGTTVFKVSSVQQAFTILDPTGDTEPALKDIRVRQALNYAVDRDSIAKAIYGDSSRPVSVMASLDGYIDELEDRYPYDPKKAEALLEQAGYGGGFTIVLATEDFAGPDFVQVAQAVSKNWEDIGITVKIKPGNNNGDYFNNFKSDATIAQVAPQYDRSMYFQHGTYLAPGGFAHPGKWTDPEIDKLWEAGSVADDPTPNWREITQRVTEQAYLVPVLPVVGPFYVSSRISGVELTREAPLPFMPDWKPTV